MIFAIVDEDINFHVHSYLSFLFDFLSSFNVIYLCFVFFAANVLKCSCAVRTGFHVGTTHRASKCFVLGVIVSGAEPDTPNNRRCSSVVTRVGYSSAWLCQDPD